MNRFFSIITALIIVLSVFVGCTVPEASYTPPEDDFPSLSVSDSSLQYEDEVHTSETDIPTTTTTPPKPSMSVHVIDVGQGQSVLVESAGEFMLVDTGESEYSSIVADYLNSKNVKKLKYAVATHPHSDHIGCYSAIINEFDIDLFMMPNVQHSSSTFERMLIALNEKNVPVRIPEVGQTYDLGTTSFTILSPSSSRYNDLNDYSIGIRIECGDTSFIMVGDATRLSEEEMLNTGLELNSDVMMVPHHASDTSSSSKFIKAISPSSAIISCGRANVYGHPDGKIVARYKSYDVQLYRTDLVGNIVVDFDDKNYTVSAYSSSNSVTISTTVNSDTANYIGNKKSKVFHTLECNNLPSEKNRVYFDTRDAACINGYKACGFCNP